MVHVRRAPVVATILLLLFSALPRAAADSSLRSQARRLFQPLVRTDAARDTSPLVRLGRLLFFEPRVSSDGTVSCARCHQPALYGTDGLARSVGAEHRLHPRHAPTVLNASLQFVQHWRGDRASVEEQAAKSLTAAPAFGNADDAAAMAKLKAISGYGRLFAAAFPSDPDPVRTQNFGAAVGAYVRTLRTPAPFDAFLEGDDAALSATAQAGLRTFMDVGCAGCHRGVGVGGDMYQKFGMAEEYWKATGSAMIDRGRFDVTQDPADLYVFKVPTLRNVAMTPPYFHDGSVATLAQAVRAMARVQLGRPLDDRRVADIVAFLESLTGDMPADFVHAPPLPAGPFPAPPGFRLTP